MSRVGEDGFLPYRLALATISAMKVSFLYVGWPSQEKKSPGNAETIPWRRFRSGPVHHRRRGQKVPRRARFVRIVVRYLECREMAHSGKERP